MFHGFLSLYFLHNSYTFVIITDVIFDLPQTNLHRFEKHVLTFEIRGDLTSMHKQTV